MITLNLETKNGSQCRIKEYTPYKIILLELKPKRTARYTAEKRVILGALRFK